MVRVTSANLDRPPYDGLIVISFGGPEKPEDVAPFLENVLRGKRVPDERVREVAGHYEMFGGVSPINAQNRALLAALVAELNAHGPHLPVYWGNRNWHPLLLDTLQEMADDGVRSALAFVTSAFASYAGCRQYLEDIEHARDKVGARAPNIDKLRLFYNHPGFIETMAARLGTALAVVPAERRAATAIVFTAHSIPVAMAAGCAYAEQLHEACRLVSERAGCADWTLAYQSRSGPPEQPWLEPDIGRHIVDLHAKRTLQDLVVVPIGFLSEHMEVVYDLDVEVAARCEALGIHFVRASVAGCHPRFIRMIRELILERFDPSSPRPALGSRGPSPDDCSATCCRRDYGLGIE